MAAALTAGSTRRPTAAQSWTKLTKGLPTVEMGRIGLGINWKNPNTVYALVTAQNGQGGFFRSDDAGASWTRIGRTVPTDNAAGVAASARAPRPYRSAMHAECTPSASPSRTASVSPSAGAASASAHAGRRASRRTWRTADDCYRGGDPGYYNEIFVDGHDPETIWSP